MPSRKLKKFLNNWMTIYRPDAEGDKYGGVQSVWAKKYWTVPCRIYGLTGMYEITVAGKEYYNSHKMMCEYDVDVKVGDKIEDVLAKEKYFITRVNLIHRGRQPHHKECLLARVNE